MGINNLIAFCFKCFFPNFTTKVTNDTSFLNLFLEIFYMKFRPIYAKLLSKITRCELNCQKSNSIQNKVSSFGYFCHFLMD